MTITKDLIEQAVDTCDDWRAQGRECAEANINTFEALGVAPLDLVEFAYGMYEYFCEYLGFTQQEEGSTSAWEEEGKEDSTEAWEDWKWVEEVEEDEEPAIKAYCPVHSGRIDLIQLADALVREFGQDYPYDPTEEVMPAPLAYWFREGVPSTLTFDWEWLAAYCYGEIADAYKEVRERWLPALPELAWDEV